MQHDPFTRGPAPVGVRTIRLEDPQGRELITEVWYPAAPRYRGADLADATRDTFTIATTLPSARQHAVRDAEPVRGARPLVMYWHGGYGHRRESTQLCAHLASHGYVVAAPDFPGDHVTDILPRSLGGEATIAPTSTDETARNRPAQAVAALDGVLAAAPALGIEVSSDQVGSAGISMGGYTSLAVNSLDRRFAASFAMNAMYGKRGPIAAIARLQHLLRFDDWPQQPHVFVLAGEADPITVLPDLRELYARLPAPKRFAALERAGHMHFVDGAEAVHELFRKAYLSGEFPDHSIDAPALGHAMRPFAELVSEQDANATARGLLLAHMDSALRADSSAQAFLDRDLSKTFATRGIALEAAA